MSELRPQSYWPRIAAAAVLISTRLAAADEPRPTAISVPPLARIRDDQQLTEVLQAIAQDPAIAVDDPAIRLRTQAVMAEGVHQLQARAYDQALANFLEAYARFPSPKILLNIGFTLRDMGRLADAANTYQRYLSDPATGGDRASEVKELLVQLDEQLTLLAVRVFPRGSELSIDGGPFIAVGSSLVTRVRPGIHLIRIRKGALSSELTVNGFEGETKEVAPTLQLGDASPSPEVVPSHEAPPEHVEGWLIAGTSYGATSATSRERKVYSAADGRELAAIVPRYAVPDAVVREPDDNAIETGALGVVRIDGKGRGFAGGLGLAIARGPLEAELMVLKSSELGGYLGVRYRLLTGWVRPYLAIGVPGFAFDHAELQSTGLAMTTKRLAVGLRGAAGVELTVNGHVSVQADLGFEHFFFLDSHYEADVLVPSLGVIGRL